MADRAPSASFRFLLKGKKTRGQDREVRTFNDGRTTDIYVALLHGMAAVGQPTMSGREIARVIERDFRTLPPSSTITGTLNQMTEIAEEHRGSSDAVLAYKDDSLHIMDPFLLFYLKHGTWTVVKDPQRPAGQAELPLPE